MIICKECGYVLRNISSKVDEKRNLVCECPDIIQLRKKVERDPREFAISSHKEQKYDDKPYIFHLDQVVSILKEYGYDDSDSVTAGYLHDVLEDCKDVDLSRLNQRVINSIKFCSDEIGHNRKTRKALTYKRNQDLISKWADNDNTYEYLGPSYDLNWIPLAIRVKICDRLANIRYSKENNKNLFEMYRKERFEFQLSLSIPRTMGTVAYIPDLYQSMWNEYNSLFEDEEK